MKTKIVIIGGGPAGLLLSLILNNNNIDNIILEKKTSEHVANRIRAGILEPGTVKLLKKVGVGERLTKEGLVHKGFSISCNDKLYKINLKKLANKNVTVYGQTEVTRDLMNALNLKKGKILYKVSKIRILNTGKSSLIEFVYNNKIEKVKTDFIIGCDGYHGITKDYIPKSIKKIYKNNYDFGWLGILSNTKPISKELVYINNKDGFALCSMRSKTRSRYYVQCDINDNIANWSDDRFWNNLYKKLPADLKNRLQTGVSIEKSIAVLRNFIIEPMSYKNIFLAGDAAHIVPPTGAKGLNLAISDISLLSKGLIEYYKNSSESFLKNYSMNCLDRVWKTQRFSSWMTYILHNFPKETAFTNKLKQTELNYLLSNKESKIILANNYIGNY